MNRSNLLRRLLGGISVVAIVAIITFSGCTNIDYSLGDDLTLENQSMKVGQMNFDSKEGNYFESRLYITDSINSACLTYGYMGTMGNDTFGTRSAGFFTQYIPYATFDDSDDDFDEDYPFGYLPVIDSVVIYLSIASYGGDTTVTQQFEIFEVIDDSFVKESTDSIFFPNFDMTPYLADEPAFTFSYPDYKNEIYVSTSPITMQVTDQASDLLKRLLLSEINGDYDYEIYEDEEEWVEQFKGLYIRPVASLEPITSGVNNGAIYALDLSSSGFGFYGRSREEDDPTLIKDTTGMTYIFYSSSAEDAGNFSINNFAHNYENSLINLDEVKTADKSNDQVPLTSTLRVEGMAGVVSQINLTEEFFEQLDTILGAEEAETGDVYSTLFFNQAMLKIYMNEITSYDVNDIDPFVVTPWMNVMPTSLGLYLDYSYYYLYGDQIDEDISYVTYENEDGTLYYISLRGIADYSYAYESSYTLDYSGELNRSWGCYVMNITSHIQSCWNLYVEAKEEAEENGTEINWDDVSDRFMYLAPKSSNLFSTDYASLQAGDGELNSAPMYLELTYTMIR